MNRRKKSALYRNIETSNLHLAESTALELEDETPLITQERNKTLLDHGASDIANYSKMDDN